MSSLRTHETEHTTTVNASADVVYKLIENVIDWPIIFPPSVHAERIEGDAGTELIRIWAIANGVVKSWTSRRELDRERLCIRFRQEVSQDPVAMMGGEWSLEPQADDRTVVRFKHHFQAVGDDEEKVAFINRAVDQNSRRELAALDEAALQARRPDLVLTFDDTVRTQGSVQDVYDFLYDAAQWEERLPHVSRVVLEEAEPNVQTLEMDTRTADGSEHTTKSVRVCFPHGRIVYKQLSMPGLMSAHTGQWTVRDLDHGVEIVSTHTVAIDPRRIPDVLGSDAGVSEARAAIRKALGRNSTATMELAKEHAIRVARL